MGITKAEWTILSLLLNHKSANTRLSTLTILRSQLPIQAEPSHDIVSIRETQDILNSLAQKGIIKINDSRIFLKKRRMEDPKTKRELELTKLEKLNLLYILGMIESRLRGMDPLRHKYYYEAEFINRLESLDEGLRGLLPISYIEKYIGLVRSLLSYEEMLQSDVEILFFTKASSDINGETDKERLETQYNVYTLLLYILVSLIKYLEQVDKLLNGNRTGGDTLRAFIYLYPFLEPFIVEGRETMLNQLKEEIEAEKQVIYAIKTIKEDENEKKVTTNLEKINMLQSRLIDLVLSDRRIFMKAIPVGNSRDLYYLYIEIRRFFESHWLPPPMPPIEPITSGKGIFDKFYDLLVDMLHRRIFSDLTQGGKNVVEIDLPGLLEKLDKKIDQLGEYSLGFSFNVPLVWMNDTCPASQDSVINSDGSELVLCKNPECFVVYHKKCLDLLLKAGVSACLVCGTQIESYESMPPRS